MIEGLARAGTTVLLTTQYLDEADRLAGRIAVVDHGRVVASGTPDDLKRSVGGERIDVRAPDTETLPAVRRAVAAALGTEPALDPETGRLTAQVADGVAGLRAVARELDRAGLAVNDLALRRPTLDEVFLALTEREVAS